jgi:hypothetical protein
VRPDENMLQMLHVPPHPSCGADLHGLRPGTGVLTLLTPRVSCIQVGDSVSDKAALAAQAVLHTEWFTFPQVSFISK